MQNSTALQPNNYLDIVEIGLIRDSLPIRTAVFSSNGDYFALGTNTKSIKIYSLSSILDQDIDSLLERPFEEVQLVWNKSNHHTGSIYTMDWSKSGKFIATGSNDKTIKIVSVPNFEIEPDSSPAEQKLLGHKAIVRSLQFNAEETQLFSAGQLDQSIKIWDISKGVIAQ